MQITFFLQNFYNLYKCSIFAPVIQKLTKKWVHTINEYNYGHY